MERGSEADALDRWMRSAFPRAKGQFGCTEGQQIGEYRLTRKLGHGGMGLVWAAEQLSLDRRPVALKFVRPDRATPRHAELFEREARAIGRLSHPGIVAVLARGESDGLSWIAMELVPGGRTLRDWIDDAARSRDIPEGYDQGVARIVSDVAVAMQAAHEAGVVHRDLKPRNILMGPDGRPKVTDFGMARIVDETALTKPGEQAGGTTHYMSPEQIGADSQVVDSRSDVFSLGIVLYELLTLQRPFQGDTDAQIAAQILYRDPPDPRTVRSRIPRDLAVITGKALEKKPGRRYATMAELAADLRRFLASESILARPPSRLDRFVKWVRRNPGKSSGGVAVSMASIAVTLLLAEKVRSNKALERERGRLSDAVAQLQSANHQLEAKTAESESRRLAAEASAELGRQVMRLSSLQTLDELVTTADELWPASPELLEEYAKWILRAEELIGELPEHEKKLAELRAEAATPSSRDLEAAITESAVAHGRSRFELQWTSGVVTSDVSELDVEVVPGRRLWLVVTTGNNGKHYDWANWIEPEFLGQGRTRLVDLDWLVAQTGWAQARKGMNCEGGPLTVSGQVIDHGIGTHAPSVLIYDVPDGAERFHSIVAIDDGGSSQSPLADVEFQVWLESPRGDSGRDLDPLPQPVEIADRAMELSRQAVIARLRALPAAPGREEDRWWQGQLEELVDGIKSLREMDGLFSKGMSPLHGWGILRRFEFSNTIVHESTTGPEAAASWREALASIADESLCPQYRGLRIEPIVGLIPIGQDPSSKLWEFAHLQTGEPARRAADGKLAMLETTGLVFVLLPEGSFTMGMQREDPAELHYDRWTEFDEAPPRSVQVAPFLISKYEMTQGQWFRFAGVNPSRYSAGTLLDNWNRSNVPMDLTHPVENVSWDDCTTLLRRLGLTLPSEVQWEYAARAGTESVWWTGDVPETTSQAGNMSDKNAMNHGGENLGEWEPWDDGYTAHAPVGRFAPNPFGLYDTIGNVEELCQNRSGVDDLDRVVRGGSFLELAVGCRSAHRETSTSSSATTYRGLRPVLELGF